MVPLQANQLVIWRVQRFPGGRAPQAIPNPLTGGPAVSPMPSLAEGSGSASGSGFGCGAVAGWAGVAVFFAPGRRAPAAMPRPFTGASGVVSGADGASA